MGGAAVDCRLAAFVFNKVFNCFSSDYSRLTHHFQYKHSQTHPQRHSLTHPGPSSMEMCRGWEGRADQWSAAGQRSWGASGQRLRFVWSSGGSLILTRRSSRHPAHSRGTLGGQRRRSQMGKRKGDSLTQHKTVKLQATTLKVPSSPRKQRLVKTMSPFQSFRSWWSSMKIQILKFPFFPSST